MVKIIYFITILCFVGIVSAQLSTDFYSTTCADVLTTIKAQIDSAVGNEPRMGASILRLHFHDCFVQASLLSLLNSSIFSIFSPSKLHLLYMNCKSTQACFYHLFFVKILSHILDLCQYLYIFCLKDVNIYTYHLYSINIQSNHLFY